MKNKNHNKEEVAWLLKEAKICFFFNLKYSLESSLRAERSWFMIITCVLVVPVSVICCKDLASTSKISFWRLVLAATVVWARAIFSLHASSFAEMWWSNLAFFLPIGRLRLDWSSELFSKSVMALEVAVDERGGLLLGAAGASLLGLLALFFLVASWNFWLFSSMYADHFETWHRIF